MRLTTPSGFIVGAVITDPTDIHGQERQREQVEQARKLRSDQEAADYGWLMADKRGRRIVAGLLERAGVFRSVFAGENSHTMAFYEGQRNAGLALLATINEHAPKGYALMLEETRK